MAEGMFSRIRETCAKVAEQATQVRILHERIPDYAISLPLFQVEQPEVDAERHYLGHGDETVAFFMTLDAVNFGSGYFPHMKKRPGMSGYFTVATHLNDHFVEHGPLTALELRDLSVEDCAALFGQDTRVPEMAELMGLFSEALNDLGHFLLDRFEGSFRFAVDAAEGSAERLVGLLRTMPFFDDEVPYGDLRVPFFKRAQLTAADLALAFRGTGPGRFHDLASCTIFADNLVPHVLRMDGILRYGSNLARRIERESLIPSGSAEEVEIRACAVHAVELIAQSLRDQGASTVTASGLDFLLWNRGHEPAYKAKPRHRTRTVFY